MGAIEVEPVPPAEGIPDTVRHWHTALGLDVLEPGFVELPVEDAAAIPGVVTKFSAVQDGRRYVVRRHGAAGSFILKLPTVRHPDLVANEIAGYRLCGALGLDCAEASVIGRADADLPEQLPFEQILAVRRFDRTPDGGRIHMEEFAQVLQYEPRQKYGRGLAIDGPAMLRVLDRLSPNPVADVREFVRRIVAFILLGNSDAHLKNWALRYPDGVAPVLAPLYDPVCVAAFFEQVPGGDYAVNRAIDAKLRGFGWAALEARAAPDGDADLEGHDFSAFDVPACAHCGGLLKPDVVFFGESVPRERVAAAFAALEAADAVLVAGSSLMVYSGFRFVQAAAAAGKPV
eukprot:gene33176-37484_t